MASTLDRLKAWLRPLVFLGRNKISQAGAILTTSSAFTLIAFWLFEVVRSGPVHPYSGIVFILVLPFFFLLGLVLIPVGIVLQRRMLRKAGQIPAEFPKVDLGDPSLRRAGLMVSGLTFANVVILSLAAYLGVEYMDSSRFCGLTCHTVMSPEYNAYLNSPHSRVACVSCHIGPGAAFLVKAKVDGVRQVIAVAFNTYARPIPSPVHTLRPARATCEECHWPQKFVGDKLRVITKFGDDEKNTQTKTVLLLKLGGRTWQGATGIHGRHLDDRERISYLTTDARREVIPAVSYIDDAGKTVEYASTEVKPTPDQVRRGERRTMDCIDCHNRPTHVYQLPERAVNEAMAEGRIGPGLPFVKKKSVELLKAATDQTRQGALERIGKELTEFYRTKYPDVYQSHRAVVESSVREVQRIYERNVSPEMKLTWGTHPNHLGHEDFLGCFRCHDGNHKSADGKFISSDCDTCHALLAQDEANPKVLADLGVK